MAKISRMTKKRLGDLLLEAGLITEEQIQHALAEQRNTGELVGEVLVRLQYITEEDVATTLVQQFGVPFIRVAQYYISKEMVDLFPEAMLRQYMFVPVDRIGNVLVIVSAGVLNQDIVNELERATNCKVQLYIGIQSEVRETIEKSFHTEEESSAELSSLGSLLLGEEEGGGEEAGNAEAEMTGLLAQLAAEEEDASEAPSRSSPPAKKGKKSQPPPENEQEEGEDVSLTIDDSPNFDLSLGDE